MKRILYISNVIEHINSFHVPYIKKLRELGYTVDVMTNAGGAEKPDYCDSLFDISIERNPFHLSNIKAIEDAKRIININEYDLIHVHTPMGGAVGRLAAKEAKKSGTKIIYTSHGFHFYKGAPILNWAIYYTVEKYLTRYTDCIITINKEDYQRAKEFAPTSCKVMYMDGVGVNLSRFCSKKLEEKERLKTSFGYGGKTILLYAAEFIPRKNHVFLINSFSQICNNNPDVILLLAGRGEKMDDMQKLVSRLNLEKNIFFLGYRKDIPQLLGLVDIVVSTSHQEGFPINLAEAVASGVPSVASRIRGNIDIIENGFNGYLYTPNNTIDFCEKALKLIEDKKQWEIMSENCSAVSQKIDVNQLVNKMMEIYSFFIK